MMKFDAKTRLIARQALREAQRMWPEDRVSEPGEPPPPLIEMAPPRTEPLAAVDPRLQSAPMFARLILGALALAFGIGLAWVATSRMRRA